MEIKTMTSSPVAPSGETRSGEGSVVVPPPANSDAGSEAVRRIGGPVQPEPTGTVEGSNVEEAVTHLNEYIQNHRRNLEFSVDESTGRTVITVIDTETDQVIRQIPPEEVLQTAQFLNENTEKAEGAILRVKA